MSETHSLVSQTVTALDCATRTVLVMEPDGARWKHLISVSAGVVQWVYLDDCRSLGSQAGGLLQAVRPLYFLPLLRLG